LLNVKILNLSLNADAAVSVVIPCFRCASTIKRAIDSVVQQTRQPAEVILIEDGSGDETLTTLQALAEIYPEWIKIIALPENQGAANARNVGWEAATQPYIAFLDADDAWHSQKIEIQIAYMNAHPEVVLCGHQHRFIAYSANFIDWQIQSYEEGDIPKWLWLLSNKFAPTSAVVRRDVYQRFTQNQRYMEDYGLWLDIVFSGNRVTKLSADLAVMYKKPFGMGGLSAQLWFMEQGELLNYQRLYEKNYINLAQWLALCMYSLLKFVRRLVIYWGWLRWTK
jgi:glycosyltransferase involved in cell wall biosynthesis